MWFIFVYFFQNSKFTEINAHTLLTLHPLTHVQHLFGRAEDRSSELCQVWEMSVALSVSGGFCSFILPQPHKCIAVIRGRFDLWMKSTCIRFIYWFHPLTGLNIVQECKCDTPFWCGRYEELLMNKIFFTVIVITKINKLQEIGDKRRLKLSSKQDIFMLCHICPCFLFFSVSAMCWLCPSSSRRTPACLLKIRPKIPHSSMCFAPPPHLPSSYTTRRSHT